MSETIPGSGPGRFGVARAIPLLAAALGVVVLSACASSGPRPVIPQPVTVEQIVSWTKEGVTPDDIIRRMRNSRTVYRLKASQLAELRDKGVADKVIDYMQHTYLAAVRRSARLENWHYWYLGGDGFWYGGIPYGWPNSWYWPDDDFFPNVGIEGGGDEEHEGHEGHEGHGGHLR